MSFKVDEKEWRDEVRRHFLHIFGGLEDIPEDVEGTYNDHPFHGKAELLEARIAHTYENGFADALKAFYEEYGFYPPLAPEPRLQLLLAPRSEQKAKPNT